MIRDDIPEIGEGQLKLLRRRLLELVGEDEDAEKERQEYGEYSRSFMVRKERNKVRAHIRNNMEGYLGGEK